VRFRVPFTTRVNVYGLQCRRRHRACDYLHQTWTVLSEVARLEKWLLMANAQINPGFNPPQ
jgi:hypothetical protein